MDATGSATRRRKARASRSKCRAIARRNPAKTTTTGDFTNSSSRVLVIEDNEELAYGLQNNLEIEGYAVAVANDGLAGLRALKESTPDLIILDLMLPKLDGFRVLKSLRGDGVKTPVLILTARDAEMDKVRGLKLGADDYVTKPFSPRELTLRVKSILSRRTVAQPAAPMATIGLITIDRDAHEIRVKGRRVEATAVEYKLLNALCRQPGKVFSREELLDAVWGAETEIEIRTVDTHLRRLREKLVTAAEQVQTVRGFGYRLDDAARLQS